MARATEGQVGGKVTGVGGCAKWGVGVEENV